MDMRKSIFMIFLIALLFLSLGYVLKIKQELPPSSGFQSSDVVTWSSQTKPGKAVAKLTKNTITLENKVLKCSWDISNNKLVLTEIQNLLTDEILHLDKSDPIQFVLENGEVLRNTDFTILDYPNIKEAPLNQNLPRRALHIPGKMIELTLHSKEHDITIIWKGILRNGSNYIKQVFTIQTKKTLNCNEIVLWELPYPNSNAMGSVRGAPIVSGNIFFGYEHPTSDISKNEEKGILKIFTHDLLLESGQSIYANSIIGVSPKDQLRRAFLYYIERERAHPYHQFLHYNGWYDISEQYYVFDIPKALNVINQWGEKFIKPYNISFQSFAFDDGWDDYNDIWRFDKERFPQGFTPLTMEAEKYGTGIGVWMSPFGGYAETKQARLKSAKRDGFEINDAGLSLAGPKYYKRFEETALNFLKEYKVNYFKFDGFGGMDPRFLPDMEAASRLLRTLRKENPDVFINITVGSWPSPFWLNIVDCSWRSGQDLGHAGVGDNMQKMITYRDGTLYSNIVLKSPLYPLNSVMTIGVVYAKLGIAPKFVNEGDKGFSDQVRSYFGSGTNLQELYVSYDKLNDENWKSLAEVSNWAKENEDVFVDTHWIGGNPLDLQVYGWASWSPHKGIITLRNPSDIAQDFELHLRDCLETPPGYGGSFKLKSPWKEDERKEEIRISADEIRKIKLQPFEVINMEVLPD